MISMTKDVESYFTVGCGRCELGGTPACKVNSWVDELRLLRSIVLACGLTETSKWGVPCYTFQNHNVVTISAFKAYCAISFFKGSLLRDEVGLLEKPGPNSQQARLLKFSSIEQINLQLDNIKTFIFDAIALEKAGIKFDTTKKEKPHLPDELLHYFREMPELKKAFETLTPGRQRGYLIHFSQPKQAKTRASRVEKYIQQILDGKGLHDY